MAEPVREISRKFWAPALGGFKVCLCGPSCESPYTSEVPHFVLPLQNPIPKSEPAVASALLSCPVPNDLQDSYAQAGQSSSENEQQLELLFPHHLLSFAQHGWASGSIHCGLADVPGTRTWLRNKLSKRAWSICTGLEALVSKKKQMPPEGAIVLLGSIAGPPKRASLRLRDSPIFCRLRAGTLVLLSSAILFCNSLLSASASRFCPEVPEQREAELEVGGSLRVLKGNMLLFTFSLRGSFSQHFVGTTLRCMGPVKGRTVSQPSLNSSGANTTEPLLWRVNMSAHHVEREEER